MKKNIKGKLIKEEFMKRWSADILANHTAKVYPHFIKIEIDGFEYDFYPGAIQTADRNKFGRLNRIYAGRNEWSDLSQDELLKHLGII